MERENTVLVFMIPWRVVAFSTVSRIADLGRTGPTTFSILVYAQRERIVCTQLEGRAKNLIDFKKAVLVICPQCEAASWLVVSYYANIAIQARESFAAEGSLRVRWTPAFMVAICCQRDSDVATE